LLARNFSRATAERSKKRYKTKKGDISIEGTFLLRLHAAFGAPPWMKKKFSGLGCEAGQSVAQASLEGDCLEVGTYL
jgi:hypothetical protein